MPKCLFSRPWLFPGVSGVSSGAPGGIPGKLREKCWKTFPESRNATNSRLWSTGKGKPAASLGSTQSWTLTQPSVQDVFWNRQFQPSRVFVILGSRLLRGLLGTDPPGHALESISLSPPQGSIWHRTRVKSGGRCRIDVESTPEEGKARRIRGWGPGGLCLISPSQVKTFISCYRTPRPQKGFWSVSEGSLKGFGFWRVLESVLKGLSADRCEDPTKTLQRPFQRPLQKPSETLLGSGGSVAEMIVLILGFLSFPWPEARKTSRHLNILTPPSHPPLKCPVSPPYVRNGDTPT